MDAVALLVGIVAHKILHPNVSHWCGFCSASLNFTGMCICYGSWLLPNRMEFRKRVKKIHYIDRIECLESDNLHENFAKTRVFDLVAMVDAKHNSNEDTV